MSGQAGGPSEQAGSRLKNRLLCLRDWHSFFSFLRPNGSHHPRGSFKPRKRFQPHCHTPSALPTPQLCSGSHGWLSTWLGLLPLFLPPPAYLESIVLIRNSFERKQRGIHPARSQSKAWDARSPDASRIRKLLDGDGETDRGSTQGLGACPGETNTLLLLGRPRRPPQGVRTVHPNASASGQQQFSLS